MPTSTNNNNLDYARAELDAGKESVDQYDFNKALTCFDKAKSLCASCSDAADVEAKATELISLTQYVLDAQANLNLKNKRYQAAFDNLRSAKGYLDKLLAEGREYYYFGIVIISLRQEVTSILESISNANLDLDDAEKYLQDRRLQLAKESFKKALQEAPLLELKQRAENGLKRVIRDQERFKKAMYQGRGSNPFEAVRRYRQARGIWLDEPKVKPALEKALEKVLLETVKRNQKEKIARLCRELAEVNSDNQLAREIGAQIDIESKATDLLRQAQNFLSLPDLILEYKLRNEIEEACWKIKGRPELQELYKQLTDVQQQAAEREQAKAGLRIAEDFIRRGDLDSGVATYEDAVSELRTRAPQAYNDRLKQLRDALQIIQQARTDVSESLKRAKAGYEQCLQDNKFDTIETALLSVNDRLEQVKKELTDVQVELLPADLEEQGRQADDLREHVNLARATRSLVDSRMALSNLRVQANLLGRDVVLDALEVELRGKLKAEVPQLLAQAQEEARIGRWDSARESLRLAQEMDSENLEIFESLVRVEEYEKLHAEIECARANTAGKEDSPVELLKDIRIALDVLRYSRTELVGKELPEKINKLMELVGDGMALANDDLHNQARELINEFREAEDTPNWVMRNAVRLAEQWLKLARKIRLEGVRDSAAQFSNLLDIYKAARKLVEADPFSEQALKGEAKSRERLIVQQAQSAEKRYQWAKDAFAEDDFDNALGALDEIEAKFFLPVEQEFEGLFENVDVIEENRKKARDLRFQIEKGQDTYQKSLPILAQARALFQESKFLEAETKLAELLHNVDLEYIPKTMKKVDDFRNKIKEARKEAAARDTEDCLAGVESVLDTSFFDDFERLQQELQSLKERIDFKILPIDVVDHYRQISVKVEISIVERKESDDCQKKAAEAFAEKGYKLAASYYRSALGKFLTASKRVEIDMMIEKSEKLLMEETEKQSALVEGCNYLINKGYEAARLKFMDVISWTPIANYALNIARAGNSCQNAERLLKQDNPDEARYDLANVQQELSEAESELKKLEKRNDLEDDAKAKLEMLKEARKDLEKEVNDLFKKISPKSQKETIMNTLSQRKLSSKVFISYSHIDERWKDDLVRQLNVLKHENPNYDFWHDRLIAVGGDWNTEINEALNTACIAILMVSDNFLTSNFIMTKEMPKILERREKDGLIVIPLIVDSCAWPSITWLSSMQGRPKDNQPLTLFDPPRAKAELAAFALEIADLLKQNCSD